MSELMHYCKSCGRPVPQVPPSESNYKKCHDCIIDTDHAIQAFEQNNPINKPIHKILFGVVDFGIHERVNYVKQSDNKFVTIIRMKK